MKKILFSDQKNVVGAQLRAIRKRQKLTQTELVARMQLQEINLDQKAISGIENNRRIVTDYELAGFARALNVGEKDLLKDFYERFSQE